MNDSFHARHRDVLAALADPPTMAAVLTRIGRRNKWWGSDRVWTIDFARVLDPDRPHIQVAMRALGPVHGPDEICVIDVGVQPEFGDPHIGPMRARRFPDDPGLPTLAEVMGRGGDPHVVRYRPGKRCTLQIGNPTSPGGETYVKVFSDDRGAEFQREGGQLWVAARRGDLGFDVARPRGFDPRLRTFAQAAVGGEPVGPRLFSPVGAELAEQLGRAAASIPLARLSPRRILDGTTELGRLRKRAAELNHYVPRLGPAIDELVGVIGRNHEQFADLPIRPIHGSPHPSQWLVDGERLGLVDFDRLSLGDPEVDVATFVAEVDFEHSPHAPAVAEGFRMGYEAVLGGLDQHRLMTYTAHKHFAKVYRTARSIRLDGDARAEAHLQRTFEGLGR